MKRFFEYLLFGVLFLSTSLLGAKEAVLLDFSNLYATGQNGLNTQTIVDVGNAFSVSGQFTPQQKLQMRTSLAIKSWSVQLGASAQTPYNLSKSVVKPVVTQQSSTQFPGLTILGARIHFPAIPHDYIAYIKPPFRIPAYATHPDDPTGQVYPIHGEFDNNGVIKNVGRIRRITMWVLGRQAPATLTLNLRDQDGNVMSLFIHDLRFGGWRQLTWDNPNYVKDVKDLPLKQTALYPHPIPYIAFNNIEVRRDSISTQQDIIFYVKEIRVAYDEAIKDQGKDVNDEQYWGIQAERSDIESRADMEAVGTRKALEFVAKQLEDTTVDSADAAKKAGAAGAAAPAAGAAAPVAGAAAPAAGAAAPAAGAAAPAAGAAAPVAAPAAPAAGN